MWEHFAIEMRPDGCIFPVMGENKKKNKQKRKRDEEHWSVWLHTLSDKTDAEERCGLKTDQRNNEIVRPIIDFMISFINQMKLPEIPCGNRLLHLYHNFVTTEVPYYYRDDLII